MKKLYIRVDMNPVVATGHVMRCLAVAEAAKDSGIDAVFILADIQAEQLIRSKGFETKVLNCIWNDMETELPLLLDYIRQERVQILLVDSYYVTKKYLMELRQVTHVAYIDDLNSFHYPVDMLIVYAGFWGKMGYKECYPNTKLILGEKYVPLRREFRNLPPKVISEKVERLLILTGGSDNYEISEHILLNLHLKKYKRIDVICGRYYKEFGNLLEKYHGYENVGVYQAVDNIIDYMMKADVAISAGGTTLYELCAVGTPTITFSLADNQINNVRQFEEYGIMKYAGDIRNNDVYKEISVFLEEYSSKYYRERVSQRARVLVDGNGAKRIVLNLMIGENVNG